MHLEASQRARHKQSSEWYQNSKMVGDICYMQCRKWEEEPRRWRGRYESSGRPTGLYPTEGLTGALNLHGDTGEAYFIIMKGCLIHMGHCEILSHLRLSPAGDKGRLSWRLCEDIAADWPASHCDVGEMACLILNHWDSRLHILSL